MTIKEFENQTPAKFADVLKDSTCIWDNDSCRGYCILAMTAAGFSKEQIDSVLHEMYFAFDEKTIEEAAQIFTSF